MADMPPRLSRQVRRWLARHGYVPGHQYQHHLQALRNWAVPAVLAVALPLTITSLSVAGVFNMTTAFSLLAAAWFISIFRVLLPRIHGHISRPAMYC